MRIILRALFVLIALFLIDLLPSYAQAPVIIAKPGPITLHLDATGNYQVQLSDIATITGDYNSVTLSPANFTCNDVGAQTVIVNASNTTGIDPVSKLNYPYGLVCDASGNIYVADAGNNQIKKITPAGIVSIFAGSGSIGSADGTGVAASFDRPWGLTMDAQQNIFVADAGNSKIREITPSGKVSTVAGNGNKGSNDGSALSATFNNPAGVAVDAAGNLYIVDSDNNKIRKISTNGVVSTFAGNGTFSSLDGNGIAAGFYNPHGIAINNSTGYLYVADGNNRIRMISPTADVTTFAGFNSGNNDGAGTAASFYFPISIAIDAPGNLYVADNSNNQVRKVDVSGFVTTIAGNGAQGSIDATGKNARFNGPTGIALDPFGNLYVTDSPDDKIRKITPALLVSTLQLAGSSGTNTESASKAIDVLVASQPVITSTYDNKTVIVYPGCDPILPDYTASATASDNCQAGNVSFTQSPVAGIPLAAGTPVPVTLTATDVSGATADVTFTVNMVNSGEPLVSFSSNPEIFSGSNVKLEPVINGDVVAYQWSPAAGLSDVTAKNPVASPSATTTYTLTATTSAGCQVSANVTVKVIGQIIIPNIFTPNGDGINDFWSIAHISDYPRCTVDVFSRGGQLVFHSTGYSKPWEGTYNGNLLPTGAYYYIIDLKDGRQKISGQVTIIR
ncbi:MAG: NHL domain-containing protein [Mucilaginibacter sp.]